MELFCDIVLMLWALWIVGNVVAFLLSVVLVTPDYPHYNGFRVHVPKAWRMALSTRELQAVIDHELGHRARGHVWLNLLKVCMLDPVTQEERMQQEYEADDCVRDPEALAFALRRMSAHPFDLLRAQRLFMRAAKGQQEAGNPASGMDVPPYRGM